MQVPLPPISPASGKVYLVGAGPGNLAYLTIQAQQLFGQAAVLIYDALIDSSLLALLSPQCQLIQVGKRGGQPSVSQAEINRLLVDFCQQGKTVVRLKSGDPFIFGRATVEIQALKAAGCPFAVVPGLSSALAAPLLASIPLTDPVMSRGFGVFTAHDLAALDWHTLSHLETLVLLMGGQGLSDICQRLRSHHKRSETPVAVIQWAGQPQQQIWEGTLLSISQITKGLRLSPCIIVIGEVVRLREFVQPMTEQPSRLSSGASALTPLSLADKTILVTRAAGQPSQFSQLLSAQGATVIDLPALEITPPSSWQDLDAAIADLPSYDWLILTSGNAVEYFLDRLLVNGQDLRSLATLKIAVVGKKTAQVLEARGLSPDFVPTDYVADALVATFPVTVTGLKLLFPRVESGGREVLVSALTAQGAEVSEVAAYESACPAQMADMAKVALATGQVDGITFASSKTVRHFAQLMAQSFGEEWQLYLEPGDGREHEPGRRVAIASIGPQTSETCQALLGRVDIEASEFTLEGLTQAIVQWANRT